MSDLTIVILILSALLIAAAFGIYKLIRWARAKDTYYNLGG